jgi:hypothetical protein
VKLGLVDKLPKLETSVGNKLSQTARLLDEWEQNASSKIGQFIQCIEELGREDAVNALLCGCSLYRIITLEESMGSEICHNSPPTNTNDIVELKPELIEEDKLSNMAGKVGEDLFDQGSTKMPTNSEINNLTANTLYQPQNINSAVKNSVQLGNSNSDGDSNLSTHISMSVSGQARVNSNVSR